MSEGELILYTTEDGTATIDLRAVDGTAWLTQAQMAELFQTSPQAITRFMRPVNYLGLPALAFPAGFARAGLPIGLQFIGRPFRDETLIALGAAFQAETDFHRRMPTLA